MGELLGSSFWRRKTMKKTWLCAAILLIAFCGIASVQTGQGAIWVGGSGGFTSSGGDLYGGGEDNKDRASLIALTPIVEYFVDPNLFIGPGLNWQHASQGEYSVNRLGIGARIGYAFPSGGSNPIPYLGASFLFNSASHDGESSGSGTSILLGGGICVLAAKHAGITFEAGYQMDSWKGEHWDKSETGNIILVSIGVVGLVY
jgi:hypothetical protein